MTQVPDASPRLEVSDVRRLIPSADDCAYFQTSGYSLKPEPVIEATIRWLRFQARGPALPDVYQAMVAMLDDTRARVARALNADPSEIMLNENTTVGINQVVHGIDWEPGDNVILSTHEHPGNRIPWYNLARRRGVSFRFVPVTEDEGRFLAALDAQIDGRTRLVSVSHVSRRTGLRFPARGIVDVAHQRGVPVLFDAAQAFGAIPVDVQALGCDLYTVSGHKCIMAPQGTGAFFIRRDRLEWLKPSFVGSRSQSFMDDAGGLTLLDSAKRFEYGTRNWADQAGFGKALDLWESIGWERVFAAIAAYTDRLKAALLTVSGVQLLTPLPYDQSSGIVSFWLPGLDTTRLLASLWEHERILASPVEVPEHEATGVRLSCHVFNTDDEIDRVISGLRRIQRSGL